MEQIQSISEFRTKTGRLLKRLAQHKAILLTQHGKTRAVLLEPEAYEAQLDRLRLAEKILRGIKEIERGKGIFHPQVERLSKGWI